MGETNKHCPVEKWDDLPALESQLRSEHLTTFLAALGKILEAHRQLWWSRRR